MRRAKRIAIVGLSTSPDKESHEKAKELLEMGYDVVPIHPTATEILGRKAYARLADVPQPPPIDVVDVFRPAAEAPQIARDAVAVGARTLWLQSDLKSEEARRIATEAEIEYVEDRCAATEARRIRVAE